MFQQRRQLQKSGVFVQTGLREFRHSLMEIQRGHPEHKKPRIILKKRF